MQCTSARQRNFQRFFPYTTSLSLLLAKDVPNFWETICTCFRQEITSHELSGIYTGWSLPILMVSGFPQTYGPAWLRYIFQIIGVIKVGYQDEKRECQILSSRPPPLRIGDKFLQIIRYFYWNYMFSMLGAQQGGHTSSVIREPSPSRIAIMLPIRDMIALAFTERALYSASEAVAK